MVSRLGSIAEIKRHCGWTGNSETSWKISSNQPKEKVASSKNLSEIDGRDSIFYWVDLTTEMAFFLPQNLNCKTNRKEIFSQKKKTKTFFLVEISANDLKIFIVWFEEFPTNLDSILPGSILFLETFFRYGRFDFSLLEQILKNRDIAIIGIHPLKNNLFRILLNNNAQRFEFFRFSFSLSRSDEETNDMSR